MKRNWKIQKFWNKRESEVLWLHWWSIKDLENLKADIEALILRKKESADYAASGTRLFLTRQ